MAVTTISANDPSKTVFSNSGAAANLTSAGETEDSGNLSDITFDVLAQSGGGAKTTLWSVDDGVMGNNLPANPLVTVNKGMTGYNTDLLYKDAAGAIETTAAGGKFWIGVDNKLHYDASGIDINGTIAVGESFTDTFSYTIRMSNGTLSVGTISVNILNTEDKPVITVYDSADSDAKAFTEGDSPLVGSGTLTVTDADTLDTVGVSVAGAAVGGDYTNGLTGADVLGYMSVNPASVAANSGDTHNLTWNFDSSPDAFDFLQGGEDLKLTYTIKADDSHAGGTATHDVIITVHGTNDAAAFAESAGGDHGVTEDVDFAAGGTLTVTDKDHDQSAFDSADTGVHAGTYGTFQFDAATGIWSYALDNSDPDLNFLNAGDTATETLTVHSIDGTAYQVNVTVNGGNEAPVGPTVAPPYTGTGDPNDFDGNGLSGGQNPGDFSGPGPYYGGPGDDHINDGSSDAVIYGGSGDDLIQGNNSANQIYGGSGSDDVNGNGAADTIVGGYGADTLDGGNAIDVFKYLDVRDTGDTINGFVAGAAGDKLDFSGLGSNTGTPDPANAQPAFAVFADTAVHAHGINYFDNGTGGTTVWVDTDGITSTVELQVTITGISAAALTSANFIG